jgi:hypothetical protein
MDIVEAIQVLFPSGDNREEGELEQAVEALAELPELDDDQATACGDAVWSYEDFRAEPEVWLAGNESDKAHPFWQRLASTSPTEPQGDSGNAGGADEDAPEESDELGENDPSPEAKKGLSADALSQLDLSSGVADHDIDALLSQSGGGGSPPRSREPKKRDKDRSKGKSPKEELKEEPKEEPREKEQPVSRRIGVEPIVLTDPAAQALVLRELEEELAQKSAKHTQDMKERDVKLQRGEEDSARKAADDELRRKEREAKLLRGEEDSARKADLHALTLEDRRAKLAREDEDRVRKVADDELRRQEREAKLAREEEDRARKVAEDELRRKEREAKLLRDEEDRVRRAELHTIAVEEKVLKLAASKPPVVPPKEYQAPAQVLSVLANPVYVAGVIEITGLRTTISQERDFALKLQAVKALAKLRAKVLRATFNARGAKRAANVHLLEMFKAFERGDDVTHPNSFEGNFVTGHWIAD